MKQAKDTLPMVQFGQRIRALRQQHDLTQQAVADRMCVDRTTYNKYEAGRVSPDHQGLMCLAELYGVTVDSLLGREESLEFSVANDAETMELNHQEQMLVQMYRQLSTEEQQHLLEQAQQHLALRHQQAENP